MTTHYYGSRQRLVPWVVETWGRHDSTMVELLKGAAQVAARRGVGRAACRDDAAEQRRDARVAASIFRTWQQRLSAGLVQAVAEHFDAQFCPVAGTVARQRYSRFVPRGLTGCALDQGLLGVTGHTRNAEPRFAFALAF